MSVSDGIFLVRTMLDGNISGEEDTELRDLVMQTLENNGVLAKVRVSDKQPLANNFGCFEVKLQM